MGLVKSSSKAGSFQAQPRPWWSEKAPSPLDPEFLCNGGRTEQCLELIGSVMGTCSCGPARSKIRTKWQEPQVCAWLPGCRQRKTLSHSLGPSAYSHRPQVTPACPPPSRGPDVLTCPPQCSLGPLLGGARSPPRCSLRGGQPSSLGISCHRGPEPKHCLLPGQPPQSGSLPGPQVGPRSPESSGKLAKTPRSSVRQTGNAAQDT